jgi:hypothetical protein
MCGYQYWKLNGPSLIKGKMSIPIKTITYKKIKTKPFMDDCCLTPCKQLFSAISRCDEMMMMPAFSNSRVVRKKCSERNKKT